MLTGMITSTTSKVEEALKANRNSLDKDAFLKLLVAQLQHQDPTQSQDTNQMLEQMTSFTNLEQMQNQTKLLEGLQQQNSGIFQAQTASLIGKRVRVNSKDLEIKDGKAPFGLELAQDASEIRITIKDAKDNTVKQMDYSDLKAGNQEFVWDGMDSSGQQLTSGKFTLQVSAKDSKGQGVTTRTSTYAKVDSLRFSDNQITIVAGNRLFDLKDLAEIAS